MDAFDQAILSLKSDAGEMREMLMGLEDLLISLRAGMEVTYKVVNSALRNHVSPHDLEILASFQDNWEEDGEALASSDREGTAKN